VSDQAQGPVMLAVTNILRPPPARVGKITENVVLPRTVELRKLLAAAAGAFGGVFVWMVLVGFFSSHSLFSLLVTSAVCGTLAVFLMSWSPLKGESFATWLGLSSGTLRADRVRIDGLKVRAYLGVAPLNFTAAGRTRVLPGAIDVPVGSVDARGVSLPTEDILRRAKELLGDYEAPLSREGFEEPKPLPRRA